MRVVIVSNFDTYLERILLVEEYYKTKGFKTQIILSDFGHTKKEVINFEQKNFNLVKTIPYFKNISIKRLYSHYKFAKNAFQIVEQLHPDILHIFIPANSLAKEAFFYKKHNPKVKLYLDIIDLWPETMPLNDTIKKLFPFKLWKNVRDNYLANSDIVFTECELYQSILHREDDKKFNTLYWAKNIELVVKSYPCLKMCEIHLCYLGSINNIIDVEQIIRICIEINKMKKIVLHIIGDGEKRDELIYKLDSNKLCYLNHGVIYDKYKKQKIFDICHFGLNVYKQSISVGLTMKSLDYFMSSLPIVNTIAGDTTQLVAEYNIGYNINEANFKVIIGKITKQDISENLLMRENTKKMFNDLFTKNNFFNRINQILEDKGEKNGYS